MTEQTIEHRSKEKDANLERTPRRRKVSVGTEPRTAEAYLASIPFDVGRYRLLLLRQLLFEHAFDLEESFEGGQLVYRKDGESIFRLFLTPGFVWFTMRRSVDPMWARRLRLAHMMTMRQTLRIGTGDVIHEGALQAFVRESVGTWRDHRNEQRVQL